MQLSKGIYFEYKPAAGHAIHDRFHAYIVFRDGKGGERVIRGGIPDIFGNNPVADFADGVASLVGGDITTQVDVPLQESKDKYTDGATAESRHARKLDLGGRDPEAVWNDMAERARKVEPSDIDYNVAGKGQTSNSVIRAALEAGKIDTAKALPPGLKESDFTGYANDLSIPDPGIPPFGPDPTDRELGEAARGRLPKLKVPDGAPEQDAAGANAQPGQPADEAQTRRAEHTDEPIEPVHSVRRDDDPPARLVEMAAAKLGPDAPEARALLARISSTPETLEELIAKPAQLLTQAEIDRVTAAKTGMTGRDALFAPLSDQSNRWFDHVWGGLPPGADDAAAARIAPKPMPARTPGGATVADGAFRVGGAVIDAAAKSRGGMEEQIARLQRAMSGLDRDAVALKPDGVFGPLTARRLRAEVARGGAATVLDGFRRAA